MKLISMTDYVIELNLIEHYEFYSENTPYEIVLEKFKKTTNYAKLLKQPLKLEIFVPCDDEGNVLQEPKQLSGVYDTEEDSIKAFEYYKAQEKLLFKGFECVQSELDNNYYLYLKGKEEIKLLIQGYELRSTLKVEDLLEAFTYEFELTENAIKKYKL